MQVSNAMEEKRSRLPLIMVISMLACIVGAIFCWGVYAKTAHQAALIACLIFAAFTAHFLIIYTFTPLTYAFLGKRIHYSLPWFRPKRFEKALYARLGVKRWKSHIPTYNYDEFSLSKHTQEEVIQNMCYAEAVHEVIFAASYLPVLLGLMFSHVLLFLVTSCLFSIVHLFFVIVQRYNRPRLVRLYELRKIRHPQ